MNTADTMIVSWRFAQFCAFFFMQAKNEFIAKKGHDNLNTS